MRILLIRPPVTYYKVKSGLAPYEPLGLMYLAAYLRKHSAGEVKIIDASARIDLQRWEGDFYKIGLDDASLKAEIAAFSPDVVGISAMYTVNSKGVHDTAAIVKSINSKIPVLAGGAHASAFTDWVLKDSNIDYVVKGEGEQTLLEFVRALESGSDVSSLPGLVYRRDGGIHYAPKREFIKNLDEIPFPARDLVDMSVYLNEFYNRTHSMTPPRSTVVTSRGCPYNCVFCSIQTLWDRSYRARSAKDVVDELELLVSKYGVREIAFFDDNISMYKKRMGEICDEIIKRKLKIKWCTPNGIAIWTLDKELLLKMRKSGCYKLTFGIETGSLNTQKFIRKTHIDLQKAKELISYCSKIGIWTHSPFILGFPYETKEDMDATLAYALDSGLDMATFFIATPYPGTDLYDIYKRENLLPELGSEKSLEWLGAVGRGMADTKNFKREEIEAFVRQAQKKVFIRLALRFVNPFRFLRKLGGLAEISYFLRQVSGYGRRLLGV